MLAYDEGEVFVRRYHDVLCVVEEKVQSMVSEYDLSRFDTACSDAARKHIQCHARNGTKVLSVNRVSKKTCEKAIHYTWSTI